MLAAAAVSQAVLPRWAPGITSVACVLGFLLPSSLMRRANLAVRQQDFPAAARLSRMAWRLAPHLQDSGSGQMRLTAALAQAVKGDMAAADAALDRLRADPGAAPSVRLSAAAYLSRLRGGPSLLPPGLGEAGDADPLAIVARLRALQHEGDRPGLLRLFARQRDRLGEHRALGTLCVLAACGEVAAVDRLLAGPLGVLGAPVQAYWRAVSALAAGDPAGPAALLRIADGRDRLLALAARQRLDAPWPGPLSPEERALLAQAGPVAGLVAAAGPGTAPHVLPLTLLGRAPLTLALVALNLAAFYAELLSGGSESSAVLLRLGGLWAGAVLRDGEWWRLGSALFLHFGALHVGLNMFGLAVVGSRLEATAGPLAALFTYAVAGLASTGGVLLLTAWNVLPPDGLVGASGAIMGLLGALLVHGVRAWRRRRSGADLRAAVLLAVIAVLQVAFDLLTPQVSVTAHMCGLLAGALAAAAWRAGPPAPGAPLRRARRWALGTLATAAAALALVVWRAGA